MKDTYTKEEVIRLLVKERTRAVDIAYSFKKKHDLEIEAYHKFKELQESASAQLLAIKHKHCAETSRQIGNCISGSTGLTPDDETMESRIRENLEKEQ